MHPEITQTPAKPVLPPKIILRIAENDVPRAFKEVDRALTRDPIDERYLSLRAHLFLKQGRFVEAEEAYRQVLHISSDHGPSFRGLGEVLLHREDLANARIYFGQALRLNRYDVRAYWGNAQIALEEGRLGDAYIDCTAILSIIPWYGAARRKQNEIKDAVVSVHPTTDDGGNIIRNASRALIHILKATCEDYEHACSIVEQMEVSSPRRAMLEVLLARLEVVFGRSEDAEARLDRVIDNCPGCFVALLEGAKLAFSKKRFAQAACLYSRMPEGSGTALIGHGRSLFAQGLYTIAAEEFRKAGEISSHRSFADLWLGRVALAQNQLDIAEDHFEMAADSRGPARKPAHFGLIAVQLSRGHVRQAKQKIDDLLQNIKEDGDLLALIALVLYARGDPLTEILLVARRCRCTEPIPQILSTVISYGNDKLDATEAYNNLTPLLVPGSNALGILGGLNLTVSEQTYGDVLQGAGQANLLTLSEVEELRGLKLRGEYRDRLALVRLLLRSRCGMKLSDYN